MRLLGLLSGHLFKVFANFNPIFGLFCLYEWFFMLDNAIINSWINRFATELFIEITIKNRTNNEGIFIFPEGE